MGIYKPNPTSISSCSNYLAKLLVTVGLYLLRDGNTDLTANKLTSSLSPRIIHAKTEYKSSNIDFKIIQINVFCVFLPFFPVNMIFLPIKCS